MCVLLLCYLRKPDATSLDERNSKLFTSYYMSTSLLASSAD
jgi:hypothetical protein